MIADAIPGVNGAAFGRLKWAFLRVVFERGRASGMLNRVYSKLRRAPVELSHRPSTREAPEAA